MSEREDLLDTLTKHRFLLQRTAQGLTEEQARLTPTVSSLSIGGLIKHLGQVERGWVSFIRTGQLSSADSKDASTAWADGFVLSPQESLDGALSSYLKAVAETDELLRTVDLDSSHELPPAPWFPPGTKWSARRVFVHLIAETAQHAGHGDIIRESIDGSKTMG